MTSQRVDQVLVARGLAPSRSAAQRLVQAGVVWVQCPDEAPALITKAGLQIEQGHLLIVSNDAELRYVSRAGLKLEKALDEFSISPSGLIVLDVGQSTGGFTDCLLRCGARYVVGVDVGHSQLHESLKINPNVQCFEKLNIRDAQTIKLLRQSAQIHGCDHGTYPLACVDVSFVSLFKVLPTVRQLLGDQADCIALFKPQFEVGRQGLNKAGIVRNDSLIDQARLAFAAQLQGAGFSMQAMIDSPIRGSDGNTEFLYHLKTIDK